jgi:hypothetical protein
VLNFVTQQQAGPSRSARQALRLPDTFDYARRGPIGSTEVAKCCFFATLPLDGAVRAIPGRRNFMLAADVLIGR